MSDDLREREPLRDQADNPPEEGTRSDVGASGGARPAAPGGEAVGDAERVAHATGGGDDPPDERDPLADVAHPTADK